MAGTPILLSSPTTPNDNSAGTIANTGGVDGTSGGYPGGSLGAAARATPAAAAPTATPPRTTRTPAAREAATLSAWGQGRLRLDARHAARRRRGRLRGHVHAGVALASFLRRRRRRGGDQQLHRHARQRTGLLGCGGGGLVLIRATSVIGAGSIGARGTNANNTVLNDASGGGGAGGSVLLFIDNGGSTRARHRHPGQQRRQQHRRRLAARPGRRWQRRLCGHLRSGGGQPGRWRRRRDGHEPHVDGGLRLHVVGRGFNIVNLGPGSIPGSVCRRRASRC